MRKLIAIGVVLLAAVAVWAQATDPGANAEDRMLTPPPVNGQAYPVALDSEQHENLLRYGFAFSSGYSDNALGGVTGHPVSDINYSVWPTIGLDETTTRFHWDLAYAPGFTFYQRMSGRSEADQNALINTQLRLSPHVTFSARDSFQKSSSVFNMPNLGFGGPVYGGTQGSNDSVIAPIADQLRNLGTLGITYQFNADDMIGGGGAFSDLYYSNKTQVAGLWDSSAQAGSAFYTHRISKQHYLGAMYQYQRLTSYLGGVNAETQSNSVFLFYTLYPTRRSSISFFGGPQHLATVQPAIASLGSPAFSRRSWKPGAGASLGWEGHFVSAALSYSHSVSEGGGLIGAVQLDNASADVRCKLTETLTASVSGSYANNKPFANSVVGGHTDSGSLDLERQFGEHFSVQLGYTRLHQTYNIPAIAGAPNTNRELVSFSYNFTRPLGR